MEMVQVCEETLRFGASHLQRRANSETSALATSQFHLVKSKFLNEVCSSFEAQKNCKFPEIKSLIIKMFFPSMIHKCQIYKRVDVETSKIAD